MVKFLLFIFILLIALVDISAVISNRNIEGEEQK